MINNLPRISINKNISPNQQPAIEKVLHIGTSYIDICNKK